MSKDQYKLLQKQSNHAKKEKNSTAENILTYHLKVLLLDKTKCSQLHSTFHDHTAF
jgi:hypothetical protein